MVFTAQTCSMLGDLILRPFLKPLQTLLPAAVSQAGERGTNRGTGCGRRLRKRHLLVAEGQAVIEGSLLGNGCCCLV